MNQITSVCVYCASSTKIDQTYFDAAIKLGITPVTSPPFCNTASATERINPIFPAPFIKRICRFANRCPNFMVDQGWNHTGLTELIEVESMHERKRLMAEKSDAVIALPGGCGTLEELLEIITWKQLGLYLNPIVILNTNGFFDPLLEMLENAIEGNFMRKQHGDIWHVAHTPEEAVELVYSIPVWDGSIRKFAAI